MTLILHIPFKSGIVLVSDNQNSYSDERNTLENTEIVNKVFVSDNKDYALGCAGDTLFYQNMYYSFRPNTSINANTIIQEIKKFIDESQKSSELAGSGSTDIELFVVKKEGQNITSLNMLGKIERDSISSNFITALGKGAFAFPKMLHNLDFEIEKMEEKDAINLGTSIIDFVSEYESTVGGTKVYGAMAIVAHKEKGIKEIKYTAENTPSQNLFKIIANLIKSNKIKK